MDTILDIPDRTFSVFARRRDDLLSSHHPQVFGSSEPKPGVSTIVLTLERAVRISTDSLSSIQGGEHVAVIFGETSHNRPTVMPLGKTGPFLVPADGPVVPLLIRDGEPVAVGSLTKRTNEQPARLEFSPRRGRTTVLLTFQGENPFPEGEEQPDRCGIPYSSTYLRKVSEAGVPMVELTDSHGKVHHSELQAIHAGNLFESVYVFRDLPHGPASIKLKGRLWQTAGKRIDIPQNLPVLIPEPVQVELGATLEARVDLPIAMLPPAPPCEKAVTQGNGELGVGLYDCGNETVPSKASSAFLKKCTRTAFHQLANDAPLGLVTFTGLAPGRYVAAVMLGDRTLNVRRVELEAGQTAQEELSAGLHYVAGRVTNDGKPVAADVRFTTGTAVTQPHTGEYLALLSDAPGAAVVHIVACDESFVYMHKPSAPVPTGAGYDIELPSNELLIDVRDASTGTPVTGAFVGVARVHPEDPTRTMGIVPAIETNGRFRAGHLDEGSWVMVCAERKGYQRSCSDPTEIKRKSEELTVRIKPLQKKGRILASGYSYVFWVAHDGTITERAVVDSDGRFWYEREHPFDSVVVAGSAPLWVSAPIDSDEEQVELRPPLVPVRQVRVRLGNANPRDTVTALLWIDGVPIPFAALTIHQRYRGAHNG